MFEPIKSSYRKPTFGELLGHIFIGNKSDNYSHLAFTILGGIADVLWTLPLVGMGVGEFVRTGDLRNSLAYVVVGLLGAIPTAAQVWFLGTEGWSPEYEAQQNRDQRRMSGEIVPPQL